MKWGLVPRWSKTSKSPIRESFGSWDNMRSVLITLFGITSGMTVIWYGAQFYALFFMQSTLHVDYKTSYIIFAIGLSLGAPLVVLCGALSDRIGRRPVMIAGMLLGALTFVPSFHALANFANPGLSVFAQQNAIEISAADCTFSLFAAPVSACDKARKFFSRNGLSYSSIPAPVGGGMVTRIGAMTLHGFDEVAYTKVLWDSGVSGKNSHHFIIGALQSWRWNSRRLSTLHSRCAGDLPGEYLRGALVPGRYGAWVGADCAVRAPRD